MVLDELFDVIIEVSGNISGLQTALEITRDFGRIILGSWYGEKPALLNLGKYR
jgi:threonine dehydrogenase-like Zn-dependent dehydrogenase